MADTHNEIAELTEHIASILELPDDEQAAAFERLRDEHPASRAFLIRCEDAAMKLAPGCDLRASIVKTIAGARSDSAAMPARIGPYKILEILGEGGMGTVYLGEQKEPVRRRVALKVIKLGMATKEVIARFEAERQALARMNHACIAHVLDVGTTAEGQAYFAMEHVPGIRITDYCNRNKLGIAERIEIFQDVCLAVQHAHQKCVLHRDLKPSNVLVRTRNGKPVPTIIDFGVAKATDHSLTELSLYTEQGRLIGSPAYMSPEQAEMSGLEVDARADIYSLGVLLYELLTGFLPIPARELQKGGIREIQRRIREDEPTKPSSYLTTHARSERKEAVAKQFPDDPSAHFLALRGDLDWITMRCLEKDPNRRYQSASELAADLQRHLEHEPVDASPPGAAYRLRKFLRRRRRPVAAGMGILLSLVGGLVIAIWQAKAADSAGRAEAAERRRAERAEMAAKRSGALAQKNEREAAAALASYQQMKDVPLAEDLIQEAEHELWPAHAHKVDAMDRWLGRARLLVSRAATHSEKLVELEKKKRQLADYEDRFLYAAFTGLVANIDRLVGEAGLIAQVEARRRRASTLRVRSVEDPTQDWKRVIAAIAESDKYPDMPAIEPLLGLVPLGPDPQSELEEFAVLDTGAVPKRDAHGSLLFDGASAIVLVLIPPGGFSMGAQSSEPQMPNYDPRAFSSESPVHEVTLDAFFLSKYEMTQGQWLRVMGTNPSSFAPGRIVGGRAISTQNPVENVSWHDCSSAMRRLGLVLPTEAQWEYAARAGTTTAWWSGQEKSSLDGAGNISDKYSSENGGLASWPYEDDLDDGHAKHAPVGSFRANAYGLHDCIGNVFEWCRDELASYRQAARPGDGQRVPASAFTRVKRGGNWRWGAKLARSAFRTSNRPEHFYYGLGLRPSRTTY